MEEEKKKETVCEEANRLVGGDRNSDYGHPLDDFTKTAALWSVILGHEVQPEQVPLCMIAVKMSREMNKVKRDNVVDICGYAQCYDMTVRERESRVAGKQLRNSATGRWIAPPR